MITTKHYIPIVKTKDAELRGMCSLSPETKGDIVPLFELTRSRISKNNPEGSVRKRLLQIAEDYGVTPLGLDLTSFTDLQNREILDFYDPINGFRKWTDFIAAQKSIFQRLYPALLISDSNIDTKEEYRERHRPEIATLLELCEQLVYRVPGDYEALEFDLDNLFDKTRPPIVLLDMEFIPKEKGKIYAEVALKSLRMIFQQRYGIKTVILAGSSYPKDPAENGGDSRGENKLEEIVMFNHCRKEFPLLVYGDYATIYPLPNLRAGSHGWVPRIDFPTETSIVYYRERKKIGEKSYKEAYIRVAKKVVEDKQFRLLQDKIGNQNWGIRQIMEAANGYPPSMAPAFWISVRINLHVTLRRLILKNG